MQNINVSRYKDQTNWQCSIEPDDRAWIVFVAADGEPSLFKRVSFETDDGKTEHGYLCAIELAKARACESSDKTGGINAYISSLPEPTAEERAAGLSNNQTGTG